MHLIDPQGHPALSPWDPDGPTLDPLGLQKAYPLISWDPESESRISYGQALDTRISNCEKNLTISPTLLSGYSPFPARLKVGMW